MTFSGRHIEPWAFDGRFESLRVVPEEVLKGVRNEAPPGKFFSGKSVTDLRGWTPAPDG